MNEEIKGFVFFRSWWEGLRTFSGDDKFKMYETIFRYAFLGEDPAKRTPRKLDSLQLFMFEQIRPVLDGNITKYMHSVSAGKKGGRPKKIVENNENFDNPTKPEKTQENPEKPSENLKKKRKEKEKEKKRIGKENTLDETAGAFSSCDSDEPDEDEKKQSHSEKIKAEFEELWKKYPRKEGPKKRALRAYSDARKKGVAYEEVEQGIERYNRMIEKTGTPLRYVKQGSAWFYEELWTNEYADMLAISESTSGGWEDAEL